jgi:PAS domain S-box-containing protein
VVVDEPVNTSRARQTSAAVESAIPSLTDASNRVVVAYGAWSQKLRRRALLALVVIAGFDLAFLFASLELTKRGLVRPIHLLEEAARRIGEGNFDIPVAVTARDELATLAQTFNEMSARLGRLLKDLGESEERYRDLFEHANDLIQSVAPDGSFLYVNQAWRAALGYTEQEVASLSVFDVVHPDSKAHCTELFQRVMAGDAIPRVEVTFVTKDGRAIVAEGNVNCSIKNGRPVATRAIFRDVTERKRAEEKATEAVKMRFDFVAFVTHQLRTPLAGIKWMLELAAQESEASGELRSYISDARESADRLIRLVNDLLDASRLEGGRLSMVLQETQLGPLTQSVTDELAGLVQEKGHRLSVADGEDGTPVLVDPQLLRQVILNLVSNAVKYTPPGGEIAIRMNQSDGLMHWAIRDSGIGIPQSVQHRLFEKFYRAENASAVETEGTGLGLYLVRLIVERLGGRVSCESDEGKGATFEFTLPAAR